MPGRLTRRRLLQLSGASAATGGLAAILASGRAPAYAQGTTVHWLKFVDFVPVSDQLIKGKIKDECQKALGISLHAETIDGNGIQARTTSAIQSGSGPDIIMEINNWPQLYADSVIDVSDIAEEIGQEQAAITTRRRRSPTTARNGSQCRTRSSPTCWSIVPLGSPISASPPTTSHRRGMHTATLARS
jgi:multiple sugar transport system substrate-binding protein